MWFEKERMNWDIPSDEELVRRLQPPKGKVDMVLDTDTYNEVDDQFALSYALLSPEKLNVQAIYAAPFYNDRSGGPKDGMEKSYGEILRLLDRLGVDPEGRVFRGSERYLPDGRTPVDSPAARDLVARAMARPEDDPLYVVAIGAITNVASAILMEPRITRRIVVVWLGGHPTAYPSALEFNLSQDVPAARTIFDCGAPVVLVPCLGVASHLLTSIPELEASIGGRKRPVRHAAGHRERLHGRSLRMGKEIWDVSTVAWLLNPDWLPSKLTHSPLLTDDSHWAHDENRHLIRECTFCYRNPVFRDLFTKLAGGREK